MQKFEDVSLDSVQYKETPRRIMRSIKLRRTWLRAVSYCAELDSGQYDTVQYDTAQNLTPGSMILCGTSKKYEYLGENVTKFENILTHRSVAQAGSTDAKNRGSKISLDCPFKLIFHSLTTVSFEKLYFRTRKKSNIV